jgi:CheY-like chemotaxis protein
MDTSLVTSPRVLVVEPDFERARVLARMLRPSISFRLEIVTNADEALRSMASELPELVMTSTLLSPADVAAITGYVRQVAPRCRLPVVDLPFAISDKVVIATAPESKVFGLGMLRRRTVAVRPMCDVTSLREHIEQYLQQSLHEPAPLQDRLETLALLSRAESGWLVPAPVRDAAAAMHRSASGGLDQRPDRRRARRRRPEDLPLRWQLQLAGAPDINIVNISTSGVLLETGTQLVPGTIMDLQLLGQDRKLNVPARMIRTEVVSADPLGVRYRVAAAFARELEVLESAPSIPSTDLPKPDIASVADALMRVSAEIERAAVGAGV